MPPQANVIASAVFVIVIAATLIFQVFSARRASRGRR